MKTFTQTKNLLSGFPCQLFLNGEYLFHYRPSVDTYPVASVSSLIISVLFTCDIKFKIVSSLFKGRVPHVSGQ